MKALLCNTNLSSSKEKRDKLKENVGRVNPFMKAKNMETEDRGKLSFLKVCDENEIIIGYSMGKHARAKPYKPPTRR